MAGNMLGIKAPANLPSLVKAAFEKARAAGDLTYYPTQVAILKPRPGLTFQLRFSRALASKPKPSPSDDDKDNKQQKKPFNPFEKPLPSMTVAQLPPSHVLVLNKFAIVPEHFILATSTVKPQTHVLEADDIAAAYACIQAYHAAAADEDQELFAFFNSGPHSGASQPHRHIQLLPVAQMRAGLDAAAHGSDWSVLVDALSARRPVVAGGGGYKVADDGMPFAILTERIDLEGATAAELHAVYVRLYREAVRMLCPSNGEDEEAPGEGEARISYNLAMTQTTMALCPRVAEGAGIRGMSGEEIGSVALNGTVLAGTALVKNEAEWDALRENPANLLGVLSKIGVSSATGVATGSSL